LGIVLIQKVMVAQRNRRTSYQLWAPGHALAHKTRYGSQEHVPDCWGSPLVWFPLAVELPSRADCKITWYHSLLKSLLKIRVYMFTWWDRYI